MLHQQLLTAAALALALQVTTAVKAYAQTRSQVYGNALVQQAQTVWLQGDVGMTTIESEAAGSKESVTSTAASIGAWAGESRTLGFVVRTRESDVKFSLNNARMTTAFRDARMVVRFGWLMPSVGVSLNEVDVSKDGVQSIGVYGTGVNAGLAVAIPAATFLVVQGEALVDQSRNVFDKTGQATQLGQRLDADAHASFDVTQRLADFLVGYRAQQYSLQTGETTYQEKSQGAYVGLRLGLYF